jgi:hypothetical protein
VQNPDPLENWIKATGKTNREKETVLEFAALCGKTPAEIIAEFDPKSKKPFENRYGDLLLKFTAHQQKMLPTNTVREQVNIVRSFFTYYNLPIKFGFQAHIQFFFK